MAITNPYSTSLGLENSLSNTARAEHERIKQQAMMQQAAFMKQAFQDEMNAQRRRAVDCHNAPKAKKKDRRLLLCA